MSGEFLERLKLELESLKEKKYQAKRAEQRLIAEQGYCPTYLLVELEVLEGDINTRERALEQFKKWKGEK